MSLTEAVVEEGSEGAAASQYYSDNAAECNSAVDQSPFTLPFALLLTLLQLVK